MSTSTEPQNLAQTLAEHMKQPQTLLDDSAPHRYTLALPPGWTHHQIDEERYQAHPRRATGKFRFDDLESFALYLKRHSDKSDTTAWCKADFPKGQLSFSAVLNDHDIDADYPGHRDWSAHWSPAKSEEWKTWMESDGKPMSQVDFAYFIERNLKDIATGEGLPTGTQMLQMATNMEITQDSKFKSQAKLQSGGVRLTYIDDADEATEKAMEVFSKFAIGIQVFRGGEGFRLEARLRYRLNQGKLLFWYELVRPDVTLEAAAQKLVEQLRAEIADTGVPMYFGEAAAT